MIWNLLDAFKNDLVGLLSSKGEFKQVNREKAIILIKAIEGIQQKNKELKERLYQVKEMLR